MSSSSSPRSYSNSTRTPLQRDTSTPTPTSSKLPFFQKYKSTQVPPSTTINNNPFYNSGTDPIRPSSPTDSDVSGDGLAYDRSDGGIEYDGGGGGLAYDREDRDEEEVIVNKVSKERGSSSSRSAYSAASVGRMTRDDMSPVSPRRSHTTPTVGPRGGPGGVASPLGSVSPPGAGAARSASDAKNIRRAKETEYAPKRRVCIRCESSIDNGRWIKMDTGKGVLCERCWKNMYLPKVIVR